MASFKNEKLNDDDDSLAQLVSIVVLMRFNALRLLVQNSRNPSYNALYHDVFYFLNAFQLELIAYLYNNENLSF